MCILELKRVVESVDYVAIHGYEKSKEILKNAPVGAECYSWSIGNSGVRDKTVELVKLKQAIADYESVYSNDMGDDNHIENHVSPLCHHHWVDGLDGGTLVCAHKCGAWK